MNINIFVNFVPFLLAAFVNVTVIMNTLPIHKQLTRKYMFNLLKNQTLHVFLESVNSVVANICSCLMLK